MLDQRTFEITDNLTDPDRRPQAHDRNEGPVLQALQPLRPELARLLDLLEPRFAAATACRRRTPSARRRRPIRTRASRPSTRRMYGVYAQDVWQATTNLSLTAGVRLDMPKFTRAPAATTRRSLTTYDRSTSNVPSRTEFSPRIAFNWDVTGDQRNQLRGGIGYFTGPPPFVYLSNAFGNSGLSGYPSLTCTGSTYGHDRRCSRRLSTRRTSRHRRRRARRSAHEGRRDARVQRRRSTRSIRTSSSRSTRRSRRRTITASATA